MSEGREHRAETREVRDDLFDRLVNAYRAEGWSISAAEDAALVALKVLGFDGSGAGGTIEP